MLIKVKTLTGKEVSIYNLLLYINIYNFVPTFFLQVISIFDLQFLD